MKPFSVKTIPHFCLLIFMLVFLKSPGNNFPTTLKFIHYSTKDGLPSKEIHQIYQDTKGYIWIASNRGISKFNGAEFVNYTMNDGLIDNMVFGFYEDPKNRLWIRSFKSELCYIKNDAIIPYKYNHLLHKELKDEMILSLVIDKKNMLHLGLKMGKKGLLKIAPDGSLERIIQLKDSPKTDWLIKDLEKGLFYTSFDNRLPSKEQIVNVAVGNKPHNFHFKNNTRSKILYHKTSNNRLIIAFGNQVIFLENDKIVQQKTIDDPTFALLLDKEEKLWIGTNKGLLYYKHGMDHPPIISLKGEKISSIIEDEEGSIWVSTLENGVYRVLSKKIEVYYPSEVEKKGRINTLSFDRQNQIWLGYSNGYLERVSDGFISKNENEPYNLFHLGSDTAFIFDWKGARYGFFNAAGKYVFSKKIASNLKKVVKSNKSHTYIACNHKGVFFLNKHKKQAQALEGFEHRINDLAIDTEGTLWLAGAKKLWVYNQGKVKQFTHPFLQSKISKIQIDDQGVKYMISPKHGIIIIKEKKIHQIKHTQLSNTFPTGILPIDDAIWLATSKGLKKISIVSWTPFKFRVENFDQYMGFPQDEIKKMVENNGKLYLCYEDQILSFNPQRIKKNTTVPRLKLINVYVNDTAIGYENNIAFKHKENNLRFSFESLSYKNNGKVKLKYRLNKSKKWTYTEQSDILFNALSPNNYYLEVMSINENNIASKKQTLSFSIALPWWKEWWFYTLLSIIFLFIVFAVFKVRINRIEEKNTFKMKLFELEKQALQAQMNPHFLFNLMNTIQSFIVSNEGDQAERFLAKFAKLTRLILDGSREGRISVSDEVTSLQLYLELEKLRFENKFNFSIEVDESIDTEFCLIPPLLIQPYVENSILHGMKGIEHKGNILVKMKAKKDQIICTIKDNGIGREKAKEIKNTTNIEHKSVGLLIAKERLQQLNKSIALVELIKIKDLKDESNCSLGTKVEIVIPTF